MSHMLWPQGLLCYTACHNEAHGGGCKKVLQFKAHEPSVCSHTFLIYCKIFLITLLVHAVSFFFYSSLWTSLVLCWSEICPSEGERCIIHECVPFYAWTAVTCSCQQCILECDGANCGADTLQGPLACGTLWVGRSVWALRGSWECWWGRK